MTLTFQGIAENNTDNYRLYWSYTAPERFPGVGVVEIFKDSARTKLVAKGEAEAPASIDAYRGFGEAKILLTTQNKSDVSGVVRVTAGALSDVDGGNYLDFTLRPALVFPYSHPTAACFSGILPAHYEKNGITANLHWATLGDDGGPVAWFCDFEPISDDQRGIATACFRSVESPATSMQRFPSKPLVSPVEVSIDVIQTCPGDLFRVRIRREPGIDLIQKPMYVLGLQLQDAPAKKSNSGWPYK